MRDLITDAVPMIIVLFDRVMLTNSFIGILLSFFSKLSWHEEGFYLNLSYL